LKQSVQSSLQESLFNSTYDTDEGIKILDSFSLYLFNLVENLGIESVEGLFDKIFNGLGVQIEGLNITVNNMDKRQAIEVSLDKANLTA